MTILAGVDERTRQALRHPSQSWRPLSVHRTSMSTTETLILGRIGAPGLRFGAVWLLQSSGISASTSNYYTVQPFVTVSGTLRLIGKAVDTQRGVTGNAPMRCHAEENLDYDLPDGATVGLLCTLAGTLTVADFTISGDLYADR